tara:strand:+ start:853 stop:1557 length:705 start_codon:yes stop_codon:yes gene_type:complete
LLSEEGSTGWLDGDGTIQNASLLGETWLGLFFRTSRHKLRDPQLKWSQLQCHDLGIAVSLAASVGSTSQASPDVDISLCGCRPPWVYITNDQQVTSSFDVITGAQGSSMNGEVSVGVGLVRLIIPGFTGVDVMTGLANRQTQCCCADQRVSAARDHQLNLVASLMQRMEQFVQIATAQAPVSNVKIDGPWGDGWQLCWQPLLPSHGTEPRESEAVRDLLCWFNGHGRTVGRSSA